LDERGIVSLLALAKDANHVDDMDFHGRHGALFALLKLSAEGASMWSILVHVVHSYQRPPTLQFAKTGAKYARKNGTDQIYAIILYTYEALAHFGTVN
jgi:hypothetical protein